MLEFLLKALTVWRISHALVHEDGPYNILETLRFELNGMKVEGHKWPELKSLAKASPLHCVWCTSVWVGALIDHRNMWALSAVSIFIEESLGWLERAYGQSSH